MSNNKRMTLNMKVPDNYERLRKISEESLNFLIKKDTTYAGSWRKRGGVGAAMMLCRKWDRIENFLATHEHQYDIFDLILTAEDPEDILDDIGDLRNYLLLVEGYVREHLESAAEKKKLEDAIASLEPLVQTIHKVGSEEPINFAGINTTTLRTELCDPEKAASRPLELTADQVIDPTDEIQVVYGADGRLQEKRVQT